MKGYVFACKTNHLFLTIEFIEMLFVDMLRKLFHTNIFFFNKRTIHFLRLKILNSNENLRGVQLNVIVNIIASILNYFLLLSYKH